MSTLRSIDISSTDISSSKSSTQRVRTRLRSELTLIAMSVSLMGSGLSYIYTMNNAYAEPSLATSHRSMIQRRVYTQTRGVVRRAAVGEVARGGLPHILAELRVKPARERGRFIGFQLARVNPGSRAARAGFKAGDVIKRVNGEPIGRPDQMMHALSLLPFASEITIEFERSGRQLKWVWGITP